MALRNRHGHPVDPVPFVVSAGIGAMLLFSVGPLYGVSYGLSVATSLYVAAACAVAVTAASYHHLVWMAAPHGIAVPAALRFEQLLYLAAAFGLVLLGLSLPLMF